MFETLSDDPTLDPNYVQGGDSAPTYTSPQYWSHNLNVPWAGATSGDRDSSGRYITTDPRTSGVPSWLWLIAGGVLLFGVLKK